MIRCQNSLSSLGSLCIAGIAFLGGPIAIHGFAKRGKEEERKRKGKRTRKREKEGKLLGNIGKRKRKGKEE